ncbi:MAG: hypothetical protein KAX30_04340 [Candidatus Atribacteria bacterium]|nr:hypothetical protein [Candidatus Atribacteria bacterium]
MRKLLLLLLLLIFSAISASAWNPCVVTSGKKAAGASYNDITLWLGFEGTWSSPTYTIGADDYSAGDTTGTITSVAVVNSDAGLIGTNGLDCPTSYDRMQFSVSSDNIISGTAGRIGLKIRFTAWAQDGSVFNVVETAGNDHFDLLTYGADGVGTRELRFRWEDDNSTTNLITTTTADLVLGTIYFIEIKYDTTANSFELWIDGVSKGTDTTDKGPIQPVTLEIGEIFGGALDQHIDNLMISDDITRDFYGEGLHDDTTSPR